MCQKGTVSSLTMSDHNKDLQRRFQKEVNPEQIMLLSPLSVKMEGIKCQVVGLNFELDIVFVIFPFLYVCSKTKTAQVN